MQFAVLGMQLDQFAHAMPFTACWWLQLKTQVFSWFAMCMLCCSPNIAQNTDRQPEGLVHAAVPAQHH